MVSSIKTVLLIALRTLCLRKIKIKKIPHTYCKTFVGCSVFVPCALIEYAFINFKDMWCVFLLKLGGLVDFILNSIRKDY